MIPPAVVWFLFNGVGYNFNMIYDLVMDLKKKNLEENEFWREFRKTLKAKHNIDC